MKVYLYTYAYDKIKEEGYNHRTIICYRKIGLI